MRLFMRFQVLFYRKTARAARMGTRVSLGAGRHVLERDVVSELIGFVKLFGAVLALWV